ncbi:MAG: 2-hydroxychromene-2-carboxylate isomerase, partial [Acetobacteraceae bacterium]
MTGTIDYFYSPRSIWAYLGSARIVDLARRFGRTLVHKPVDLSKVVPASGSAPFDARSQAHRAYFFGREIERWSEYLGVPALVDPVHHRGDRTLPSGFVIAAQRTGADVDTLHHAVLQALWRDDRDVGDPAVLAAIARETGIDPEPLLAIALSDPIQAEFQANSQEAIARGVFGSPTYVVDGDMFYGQDRLMMVERALQTPF